MSPRKYMTDSEMSILGQIYLKKDIIGSLEGAGCTVMLTEDSDRYDIQEAMESLNFTQSEIFWDSLLPKSIGEDKPLEVIRMDREGHDASSSRPIGADEEV